MNRPQPTPFVIDLKPTFREINVYYATLDIGIHLALLCGFYGNVVKCSSYPHFANSFTLQVNPIFEIEDVYNYLEDLK